MATEKGTVIKIDSRGTWVKTSRTSACEGCSSRGSCHTQSGSGDMEVNALNEIGAAVGDRIMLGIDTGSLLKATFLLYIFPILALMVGAFIGHAVALNFQMDSTHWAVLCGIVFFGCAVLLIRNRANRLAARDDYRPKIIRKL